MRETAAGLASLGRGPDSMLVHMSPREVAGLQQLAMAHGGSLTTNPQTGLPEAGFLDKLLPTIIGAGLMMIPGVNAVAAPWMIGAGVGGIEALRTGDIGKGLLAGLGAFGGAGLGSALSASGAVGGAGAGAAGLPTAGSLGSGMYGTDLATLGAGSGTAGAGIPSGFFTEGLGAASATNPALDSSLTEAFIPKSYGAGPDTLSAVSGYGTGVGTLQPAAQVPMGLAPEAAKPTFMQALGQQFDTPMKKAAAGIGALGALGGFEQPEFGFAAPQQERSNARLSGAVRRPYDPTAPGGYFFTDRGIVQPNYGYAKGGSTHSVPQLEDGGFVLTKKAVDGIGKGDNEKGQRRAAAGLGAIPIKGPGTGTSDSIPTSIDGKRPALVSNGEAYVPKQEVKKRGGAKKFYALMKAAERKAARA